MEESTSKSDKIFTLYQDTSFATGLTMTEAKLLLKKMQEKIGDIYLLTINADESGEDDNVSIYGIPYAVIEKYRVTPDGYFIVEI